MLTRLFDGFTDPVFGVLGDRIQTRWGRRRPAILFSIPFLLYGVYRVFMPSSPATESDLLISMLILYVGWTIFTLAHTAWASELTTSYDGRSGVMSYLHYFGLVGMVGVLTMPLLVDVFVADPTMAVRAEVMGWLILVSLPLLTLVALVSMPEQRGSLFLRYPCAPVAQERVIVSGGHVHHGFCLCTFVSQTELSFQQACCAMHWSGPFLFDMSVLSFSTRGFILDGAFSIYHDWCQRGGQRVSHAHDDG